MQRFPESASARLRHWLGTAMFALLTVFAGSAFAVEVEGLYSAEVAIDPADPETRDTAYERALQQVLVRVTGSESAAFSPEIAALFPNPARYVLQYRPVADNAMWVALDGAAIEKALRDYGLPVWGSERPLTMVWLVVDWGGGQRELIVAETEESATTFDLQASARKSIRKRVTDVTTARGLPIRFPQPADIEDAEFNLSDIWGGFHDDLISASREQNSISVLVGRARPGDPERSRWNYYSGGQRQQWNGDIEDAFHLLADTLAGEFVTAGNEPLALVELTIRDVRSAGHYASVQRIMNDMQVIDDYRIRSVNGSEIHYAVRINGGARRLATALNFNGELEPLTNDPVTGLPLDSSALHYAYRP